MKPGPSYLFRSFTFLKIHSANDPAAATPV